MEKSMRQNRWMALAGLALAAAVGTRGQTVNLPAPDKDGWIKLFRTDNGSDFYIANNGGSPPAQSNTAFPNGTYTRSGDTLKVSGSPGGQIYFKQSFSFYHVRYQLRILNTSSTQQNCGMLLHVQANDPTTQGFPRSVESQGDPTQGMGQLWPIGDVWVTVRARVINNRLTYDPAAPKDTVYGARNWDSRVIAGKDGWAKPTYAAMSAGTGWVTQEARVYGNDSILHLVNDTVRIKYREPRVSPGGTPNNVTKRLSSGLIAWQSEGAQVWYRNIEIKLLPGDPLYTPVYAEFNARRTIHKPVERKALILRDGVLGVRSIDDNSENTMLMDLRGRALPKLLSAASTPDNR